MWDAADVNDDGKADILGSYNPGVIVSFGGADGHFSSHLELPPLTGNPGEAFFADVNGDGRRDIVAQEAKYGGFIVWLATGAETFGGAMHTPSPEYPKSIRVKEVNGDGKADLAAHTSTGVHIYLADGAGGWTLKSTISAPYNDDVELEDVDGDGKADVLTSSAVLHGNGDGTFTEVSTHNIGTSLRFADLNGDGKRDVIGQNNDHTIVGLGDGAGHFATRAYVLSGAQPFDVDRDSHPDLFSSATFFGEGNGTFEGNEALAYSAHPTYGDALAMGDATGDGKPDAIVASHDGWSYAPQLHVLPGDGTGRFGAAIATPSAQALTERLLAADLDGDQHVDLVAARSTDQQLVVMRGNGGGTFNTTYPQQGAAAGTPMLLADITGDGHGDVVTRRNGAIAVYPGNGGGNFGAPTVTAATNPQVEAAADVNGDGKLDLIFNNWADGLYSAILLGHGDGTFEAGATFDRRFLAIGDVDEDGELDLVVARNSELSVRRGVGDGTFLAASQPFDVEVSFNRWQLADVDGDGHLDLATDRAVLLGDGHGGFTRLEPTSVRGDFALLDLDSDDALDVITAGDGFVDVALAKRGTTLGLAATVTPPAPISIPYGIRSPIVRPVTAVGLYKPMGYWRVSTSATSLAFAWSLFEPVLEVGLHSIEIEYGGCAAYSPASGATSITVTKAPVTLNVSTSSPVPSGTPVHVAITIPAPSMQHPYALPPSGTFTLKEGNATLGTTAASWSGSFDVSLPPGKHALSIVYGGDARYTTASTTANVEVTVAFGASFAVRAEAASSTSIALTWPSVTNAVAYDVYRRDNGTYQLAATVSASTWTDTTRSPMTTTLYRVVARNSANATATSTPDFATTAIFSTDTIVRLVHLTQLRDAVNAMRSAAGLAPFAFTNPPAQYGVIRASHITELRSALTEARSAMGFPVTFSGALTLIRAEHVTAFRDAVK